MAHEIGSLRALPNGESLFVGSSSGVFFINTVRRAFVHSAAATQRKSMTNDMASTPLTGLPSPEQCIYGSDTHADDPAHPQGHGMGELPEYDLAKELVMTYFRTWHPLMPLLHGLTCLNELEKLYAAQGDGIAERRKPRARAVSIILQCIFNIAKLERPDLPSLGRARFQSEDQLLMTLSPLTLKSDIESIQALLIAQLYFVATMHLQAASSVGGMVLRSIYKSGLHRCPVRYCTFSAAEREMRKRVFWSAYTLDRFTSQSLGHPLGIQDSDVDVCQPGLVELHEPVSPIGSIEAGTSPEEAILHFPRNHPQRLFNPTHIANGSTESTEPQDGPIEEQDEEQPYQGSPLENSDPGSRSQRRHQNQSVQAQFVRYSRLVGRVLETFHKSIHSRSTRAHDVLLLKADIDAWGNNLPHPSLAPQPVPSTSSSPRSDLLNQGIFFEVARQHLLLLVNRPSLSSKPTSAEFRHAIQVCIGASRSIIRILETHLDSGGSLFWPGYLSAVWMGGLIMVFACQLKMHSKPKAISEVLVSLRILKVITPRWSMAQHCHDVLSLLLESLRKPALVTPSMIVASERHQRQRSQSETVSGGEKRPRDDQTPTSSVGPKRRQTRDSRLTNPWSVPGTEDHTYSFQSDSARFQDFNVNYHSMISTTNDNSDGASEMGCTELNNQLPAQFLYHDPTQTAQQYVPPIDPSFADLRNERNENSQFVPNMNALSSYDVFDGAMWGSLLEMMDRSG